MARARWAFAAAPAAGLAALLCLVALVRVRDGASGSERLSSLGSGRVLAVVGPVGAGATYYRGEPRQRRSAGWPSRRATRCRRPPRRTTG